ncbi:hypothetical protein ACFC26_13075 [Kitasatospora purpeofusca]|uniref:hypothetical protein n=1 Tax=Kitasatospora purpeofusca TaxID=67352 RepID=UPI0035E01935
MAVPPEIDHAVIAALYQFRMATAEQLRVLHTPNAGPELLCTKSNEMTGVLTATFPSSLSQS